MNRAGSSVGYGNRVREGPDVILRRKDEFIRIACIAVAYFAAHYIAFFSPDTHKILVAVWLAGGIGLAALLLNSRRLWPLIVVVLFIAGYAANLLAGKPLFNSFGYICANVLESLACAILMSFWCGEEEWFSRVRHVVALICAATLVNGVTALIGAVVISGEASFSLFWETWWIADGLGILLMTPLIMIWSGFRFSSLSREPGRLAESVLFMTVWVVASWLTFRQNAARFPVVVEPYMLVALLAWPALRLGQRPVTLALAVLAAIAVTGGEAEAGPSFLGGHAPEDRLLLIQVYLGSVAVVGFFLSTGYVERRRAERSAREEQARLQAVEDNLPNGMVYQVAQDPDGNMRFLYASAGAKDLLGISAQDLMNDPTSFYDRITEEDKARLAAARKTSMESGGDFDLVIRIYRSDDEPRWMHVSSKPRLVADDRAVWDGILTDVTEFKQAQENAQRSESFVKSILENAPHATWISDAEGTLVRMNRACRELFGITDDLAVGKYNIFKDNIVLEQGCMPLVRQVFEEGKTVRFPITYDSFRLEHIDISTPETLFLDATISPVSGPDGKTVNAIIQHVDFSEQKRAEEAMLQAKTDWEQTFNAVPDLIAVLDPDHRIVRVNTAMAEKIGATPEECVGMRCFQAVHGAEELPESCPFLPIGNESAEGSVEICDQNLGGHFIMTRSPLFDANGAMRGSVHVCRDITERKAAEKELRESENKYRILFELESDALFLVDKGSLEILDVNPSAVELYGYSREELLDRSAADISAEPDQTEDAIEGKSLSVYVRRHRKKDGTVFPVEISGTYFELEGREVHLAAVRDISKRVRVEETLKSALKEKEVLLREIHHRVKNNIQVIIGLLSLQANKIEEKQARAMLEESQRRIQAMAMIHDILYSSPDLAVIDFSEYIKRLTGYIEEVDNPRNAVRIVLRLEKVDLSLDQAVPCGLIFNELLTNAMKHAFPGGGGGTVQVEFSRNRNGEAVLVVRDDGVGMNVGAAFENSSPLGLKLIQGLLKHQLKGDMTVESDGGATFALRWPLPERK